MKPWVVGSMVTMAVGMLALGASALEPGAAEQVLERYRTEGAISAFLGPGPTRCLAATDATRICEWVVGSRDSGWSAVAAAIGTRDRVGVLCELTKQDGDRADGLCTAHPRRSNRSRYQISRAKQRSGAARARRKSKLAEYQRTTQAELDAARTLLELSRLAGALPSTCHETGSGSQLCTWQLTAHTWGHGTVVTSMQGDPSKKIRLRCELPLDGSGRDDGTCLAEVGS